MVRSLHPSFFLLLIVRTLIKRFTFGVNHRLGKKEKEIRQKKKKRSFLVQAMLKSGTKYRIPLHSEFPMMGIGKGNTGSLCQKRAQFQFPELI